MAHAMTSISLENENEIDYQYTGYIVRAKNTFIDITPKRSMLLKKSLAFSKLYLIVILYSIIVFIVRYTYLLILTFCIFNFFQFFLVASETCRVEEKKKKRTQRKKEEVDGPTPVLHGDVRVLQLQ